MVNVFLIRSFRSATAHVDNEVYLGRALERLGDAALKEQEPDIGAAFLKFAVVTKELSALMKTLVRIDGVFFVLHVPFFTQQYIIHWKRTP